MLAIAIGTAMGVGGTIVVEPRLPTSPMVRGLRVAGERLSDGTDLRGWLARRDADYRATTLVLEHGDMRIETSYGQVGASVDVDATVEAAYRVGHTGSVVKRLRETRQAARGEIDIPLVVRLDPAIARGHVANYEAALQRDPVDASLDLAGHRKIRDEPGRALDIAATVEALKATLFTPEPKLLISRAIEADVTLSDLESIEIDRVLASFETKFQTWKRGRSKNVAHAASFLNGVILRPHQTVSFNERVGPRTTERGFHKAPEIVGDELTIGIGGGTCQVSSTLYGAALYGGLKIVERRSHSRPSSYTQLGLDATVAYPRVDLKLMNPFNFTLVVHAFMPAEGTLRVELLGGEAVSDVEYKYGISRIEEYVRRITVKNWMKPGRSFRKQKGTRGMDVFSHVKIRFNDGRVEERSYYSGYRATPEVYWVAPDYDAQELPPLPAHAKGVEGQLEADGSDVYPTTG